MTYAMKPAVLLGVLGAVCHGAPPPGVEVKRNVVRSHQVGKAVWYGPGFHGKLTANGELYDMFDLTAAHRRLPLGSLVRVTNLRNRKSVYVRITDRGPYGDEERIIDLSYAASRKLGMVAAGAAPVQLELISGPQPGRRQMLE